MTETLKYADYALPNYVNTSATVEISASNGATQQTAALSVADVLLAVEFAGLNALLISPAGMGKSRLLTDIAWRHFGGWDKDGNANILYGRKDASVEDLFVMQQVDTTSGKYDSLNARRLNPDKTRRHLNLGEELSRAPPVVQNDFMDLANGSYNFRGELPNLGEGYCMFLAAMNPQEANGESRDTFTLSKALLSRLHVTLDLGYKPFKPTSEDREHMDKTSARITIPTARDLSAALMKEHTQIVTLCKALPEETKAYFNLFDYIVGQGLSWCTKNLFGAEKNAATFPSKCSSCDFPGKSLCSLTKEAPPRTLSAVRLLALGMSRVIELKYGNVSVDPLDLCRAAYQFTAFHENLNPLIERMTYSHQTMWMMKALSNELEGVLTLARDYVPHILKGEKPNILEATVNAEKIVTPDSPQSRKQFTQKRTPFTERDLKQELAEKGVGTDWVDTYCKIHTPKKPGAQHDF